MGFIPMNNPTGTVNYSTEEQDTGLTWINGKHVYQRTFMFNSIISGQGSTWITTSIHASPLNIYNTINAVGHSDTGWSYPITVAADQTYLIFMHFRYNANLGFKGFTIQYIKK